ncbi:MAG: hypothetical protein Q7S06_00625 [Nanoarchaeota archaeon]|nr:hypothetical protein [Nanoarchaeota archaeon]
MNDDQFREIKKRLDKIIAILSLQGINDANKKIEILKKMGLSSYEIGDMLGIANVRQMKGWTRK